MGERTEESRKVFGLSRFSVSPLFVRGLCEVKLAALETGRRLGFLKGEGFEAACGVLKEFVESPPAMRVDPFAGGAGTPLNLELCELVAEECERRGAKISPEEVNLFQSTNDVIPTAYRVAVLRELHRLEEELVALYQVLVDKEKEFEEVLWTGRTQLQDAVPLPLGRLFSTYSECFGRDRWRVFKSRERIRKVNLGGTAVGTGTGAPRGYCLRVVEVLREITGLNLVRAENMVEATANLDDFAEVAGDLLPLCVDHRKMGEDLRFLSASPVGELDFPEVQRGSSIMFWKKNPVVFEAEVSTSVLVSGWLKTALELAGMGSLCTNPFVHVVGWLVLEAVHTLANLTFCVRRFGVELIRAEERRIRRNLSASPAVWFVFLGKLGYKRARELWERAEKEGIGFLELLVREGEVGEEEMEELFNAKRFKKLGWEEDEFADSR